MWKKWIILALCTCLLMSSCAAADEKLALIGEWAFSYEPETEVLRVGEDGAAWYKGQDYTWEDLGDRLKLTDAAGGVLFLRYLVAGDQTFIYPHTKYHRGKEVEGQGGLIGIWEEENGGGSFVFTPAGYFLEDSSFSGNYMIDQAAGTFLLHYGDVFADTLCYYSIGEDDVLTVEYPWAIVKR